MRIAIISDTHDNIWKLAEAIPHLQSSAAVIHCGDLCSPFIVKRLQDGLGDIPVHIVWGNNDGDKRLITQIAAKSGSIHLHGDFAELDHGGISIAVTHYPEIARAVAQSSRYHLVCYGHDHTAHQENLGKTLLLNPGEVMGLNGRSSLVVLETAGMQLETIDL